MPDYNWHYEIPEISLEIIGMDTNGNHVDDLNGHGAGGSIYSYCGGQSKVQSFLGKVTANAFDKLKCRALAGTAKTVIIMQHYPADGPETLSTFSNNNNRGAQYLHLTGHTHEQKCLKSGEHGCYDILTGGGGGYKFESGHHGGFTAVHLNEDGGYTSVIDTDDVQVAQCSADASYSQHIWNRSTILL